MEGDYYKAYVTFAKTLKALNDKHFNGKEKNDD